MNKEIEQGWRLLGVSVKTQVLFTSVNAIECVQAAVGSEFKTILKKHDVIAVGPKTALCLHKAGVQHVRVPTVHSQEGILDLFAKSKLPNKLFFFRAEKARNFLQKALGNLGVKVLAIHSYQMHCPQLDGSSVIKAWRQGKVDAVLLGSPLTVRHYLRQIVDVGIANNAILVAISPSVAATAKSLGLDIKLISEQASFSGMLELLHRYFEGEKT